MISKYNFHHKEPTIPEEMTHSRTRHEMYKMSLGYLVIQEIKEDIKEHKVLLKGLENQLEAPSGQNCAILGKVGNICHPQYTHLSEQCSSNCAFC